MAGPPRSRDSAAIQLAGGLSVYATLTQARNKAQAFPWLGQYIAELEIPVGGPIR